MKKEELEIGPTKGSCKQPLVCARVGVNQLSIVVVLKIERLFSVQQQVGMQAKEPSIC